MLIVEFFYGTSMFGRCLHQPWLATPMDRRQLLPYVENFTLDRQTARKLFNTTCPNGGYDASNNVKYDDDIIGKRKI